jgi:exopolysaccharide production protein ExoQ
MTHLPIPNQSTDYESELQSDYDYSLDYNSDHELDHELDYELDYEDDYELDYADNYDQDFLIDGYNHTSNHGFNDASIEPTVRHSWLTRLEQGFAIAAVMYHSNFLYLPLSGRLSPEDPMSIRTIALDSSPMLALLKGVIMMVLFFLMAVRWQSVLHLLQRRKMLWLLMGWVVASCFWAPKFDYSMKLAIELCVVTLTAIYLAARFSMGEFLRLSAIGLGLVALINFLFCLAMPSIGIQNGMQAGAWRGVFIQKNSMARLLFFSSLVFLSLLAAKDPVDRSMRGWYRNGLILCALMISLSQSKTALLLLILLACLVPALKVLRSSHPIVFPLVLCTGLITIMVSLVAITHYEAILLALGRDPTLSGRTDLWEIMIDKILQRPWIGYGYAGFWEGKAGESIDVWYRARDMPPHGHNGFLDLSLDIGLVGLGLFLSSYLQGVVRSFRWLKRMPIVEGVFPLLFLIALFIYNITEDSLIAESSYNLSWLFYCYITSAVLIGQPPGPPPRYTPEVKAPKSQNWSFD